MKLLLRTIYFKTKANWFIWSRIINAPARAKLYAHKPILSPLQKNILSSLERDGIATIPLEELFPDGPTFSELMSRAESAESNAQVATKKTFLHHFWGTDVPLALEDPFVRLALHPAALAIANTYMGMWSRMKHYTLNRTVPVPKNEAPQFSQKWHRDPQEKRMLKMFLYLTNVSEGCGPFTYIVRSTYGKKYGSFFPQRPPEGSYPFEEEVQKTIALGDQKIMTGSAGTIIFCDTTGIHRGGYATEGERIMFTAFYAAPSYVDSTWYTKPKGFTATSLSEEARFAIHE